MGNPLNRLIAVEATAKKQWMKAVYVHKAPFHLMDLLTQYIPILIMIVVIIIGVLKIKNRVSKSINRKGK